MSMSNLSQEVTVWKGNQKVGRAWYNEAKKTFSMFETNGSLSPQGQVQLKQDGQQVISGNASMKVIGIYQLS